MFKSACKIKHQRGVNLRDYTMNNSLAQAIQLASYNNMTIAFMNSKPDQNFSNSKNFESKRKPKMFHTQRHTMKFATNGTKK